MMRGLFIADLNDSWDDDYSDYYDGANGGGGDGDDSGDESDDDSDDRGIDRDDRDQRGDGYMITMLRRGQMCRIYQVSYLPTSSML